MMHPYTELVDAPVLDRGKKSNTIYTLDIEVTSLFHYADGWDVFRPDLPPSGYEGIERAGVPYIWMFGIEADGKCNVYYGREFKDLKKVLRQISDKKRHKIIWVHNLSYETQFLLDLISGYTIEKLCARQTRKPIRYCIKELNIEFRCSFLLTNLSLEKAAKRYTTVEKASGELNYNVLRHSKSELTQEEMHYCEMDIRTLQAIIEHFRDDPVDGYGTLDKIPLTATGEVRRELRERVDMPYIWAVQKQTAGSVHIQQLLMRAFMGGITHTSYLHAGRILHDYLSIDITSDYPSALCAFRYPAGGWCEITPEKANRMSRERWAVLYHVRLHNVECKYINTYILASKCVNYYEILHPPAGANVTMDNGRVLSCYDLPIEMVLTEIDFDIIREMYDIGEIEYIECWHTYKDYLPKELILYILDLYKFKTTLKGVTSEDGMAEALYAKSKGRINSVYGCCVTSQFKGEVTLEDGEWGTVGMSDKLIEDKLEELRKSRTNCFAYHWGVWCTAYARKRLIEGILALDASVVGIDKAVAYYDTDSLKAPESQEMHEVMRKSNEEITDRLNEMCEHYEIDKQLLSPLDPKGVAHPLGLFEIDGRYQELKCLGAKRYAYRDQEGELHITVSGVNSKLGVHSLNGSLDNFKKDMIFDYKDCGKMASFYVDDQPDITFKDYKGVRYTSKQRHGICLQRVEYAMGIDEQYEALWLQIQEEENRRYK